MSHVILKWISFLIYWAPLGRIVRYKNCGFISKEKNPIFMPIFFFSWFYCAAILKIDIFPKCIFMSGRTSKMNEWNKKKKPDKTRPYQNRRVFFDVFFRKTSQIILLLFCSLICNDLNQVITVHVVVVHSYLVCLMNKCWFLLFSVLILYNWNRSINTLMRRLFEFYLHIIRRCRNCLGRKSSGK